MEWSLTNVIIQAFSGVLGGHAAAHAAKDYSLGVLGHTVTGAIGGALSGVFLQTFAATVVTGSGDVNTPRFVEQVLLQGFTGAIATLGIGFVVHDHLKRK